eukprot:SM000052S17735  [mRNA]  locus=s52:437861:440425:+ [translate_table: standard]
MAACQQPRQRRPRPPRQPPAHKAEVAEAIVNKREDAAAAVRRSRRPPERLPNMAAMASEAEAGGADAAAARRTFRLEHGAHPYGVQPRGNLLLAAGAADCRAAGLGTLAVLGDEALLDVLALLPAAGLARVAAASRALYVLAHHADLWRQLVLADLGGAFRFHGSWKQTYAAGRKLTAAPHIPLKVAGFYSDHLFQSWLCASLQMRPEWLQAETVPRVAGLSFADFVSRFEEPNRPVIITDALDGWPALKRWDRQYLIEQTGAATWQVGPVEMALEDFYAYMDKVEEERPLYLFDPNFVAKAPALADDYSVPKYFQEDLFSILGDSRPDHRWLIIGPTRSGSSFHIDPNSTSAWNAVVRGAKKWILYPPETIPPGVHPSADGADVAAPYSIMEWFMNHYEEARQAAAPPLECICKAGEVIFVPHGWWHLVVNLEDSIAITQNFVSRRNILSVRDFLKHPNAYILVSGTNERVSLHDRFVSRFEELYPRELEDLQRIADEKAAARKRKSFFWDTANDSFSGGFRFGFV